MKREEEMNKKMEQFKAKEKEAKDATNYFQKQIKEKDDEIKAAKMKYADMVMEQI